MSKEEDDKIIIEAKTRFSICEEWEAQARRLFDYDYKFANGDAHNMYQWDNRIVADRINDSMGRRPCLTINKTAQHNLLVINDAKQNKAGVNIRPVGEEASFEAAQVFMEIVRHIEYISNAESVYDHAVTFQVQAGIGYWILETDYTSNQTFDQEIYIRKIKDPRSVYLDPDINEADGSDARFGFIFDDMPKDLYEEKYPKYKDVGWTTVFNFALYANDTWFTRNTVRVAKYFRKTEDEKTFVSYIEPEGNENAGQRIEDFLNELTDTQKETFKIIKKRESNLPEEYRTYKERKVLTENIEVFKIAGNTIIERSQWIGKYIPIIRLVGTETIIDGILDRKGHTRALINAQQIYNYNTSANVEFGALQTKSPWIAPAAAIEGYEEYYRTANTNNFSYLPYNHVDEDGKEIPAPTRPQAPQSSPAYVEQMKIAQEEMMMATGQYQAQMGENENAKSGVAINARQRQGDRSTYHFIDNLAMAVRNTGRQLIDLIPKVYDTKRVMRIAATDGSIMNVTIDPNAQQAFQKIVDPNLTDKNQQMAQIIFNPGIGEYDVQSEVGPSFATRRQEAFNALTTIAAQNKEFMGIAGDILWKVADFPEAQVLAERWRKIIPPNILGDAPDPQTEQAMHMAADKIQQQLAIIAKQAKELADKEKEFDLKAADLTLRGKVEAAEQRRADYDVETKRLVALGNSGPGISIEQIQPLVKQIVTGMLNTGNPDEAGNHHNAIPGVGQGGTPVGEDSVPGVPGSRLASDGKHYVSVNNKWHRIDQEEQQENAG